MRCFPRHRNLPIRWAACGIFLALAGIAAQATAQNPTLKTRTREQLNREYLEAHRITLNVQVSDSNGKGVPDLVASDFTLFDNDQPRKIAGIHMIDGEAMNDATEVIILLDAVNSPSQELEEERQAIFNYLAHGHGPLPYPTSFALWFNGQLKASPRTTDRNELGRDFVKATKGIHSNACSSADGAVEKVAASTADAGPPHETLANCLRVHFRDSIAALDGIAQQQKTLGGRTILVWVGPGWPVPTGAEFDQQTAKARAGLFDDLANVLRDLRDAQVTIDAISPPDETREKEFERDGVKSLMAGTRSAGDPKPASFALPVMSALSGGRALVASHDLTTDLSSCIHDADAYYAVSFETMPATSPHEFHKIEVKVKRPGLDVRTMTAYYAEP